MKFAKVLPLLFKDLQDNEIDFALIGGVAIYAYGIDRSTIDVDFMILLSHADNVDKIMRSHGYKIGRRFHDTMDWQLVRDYFKLFKREEEFKQLKKRTS